MKYGKRFGVMVSVAIVSLSLVGGASAATPGENNALRSAKQYLQYSAFSRTGLVKQLKFEGYTTAQAQYGAGHATTNWSAQAVKSAKQYLQYSPFSRSGLIHQLEFEGFTPAQATYGVRRTGL